MAEKAWIGGVAIVLEDDRAVLDLSSSTYTEADQVPSPAHADNTSALQVMAWGTAPDTLLQVKAHQGGVVDHDATYLVREGTSGDWTGHEEHSILQAYKMVVDSSDVAINWARQPHAVRLADDIDRVAVAYGLSRAISPGYAVYVGVLQQDGTWTAVEVYSQTTSPAVDFNPCLVPQGTRLLCYFWVHDSGDDSAQIRMHYSDDAGATWAMGSEGVLPNAIAAATADWALTRIRSASVAGTVLMYLHMLDQSGASVTYKDQLHQYASTDFGSHFVFVDSTDETDTVTGRAGGAKVDVIATADGQFLVAWIGAAASSANTQIFSVKLGGAQDSAFDAIPVEVSDDQHGTITSGPPDELADVDLCLTEDVNGDIVLLARLPSATTKNACVSRRSADGGETWTKVGQGQYGAGSTWWRGDHALTYPRDFAAAWQAGRLVVACLHNSDTGGRDDSLCLLSLGGPSNVTMPRYRGNTDHPDSQVSWDWVWVPWDTPQTMGAAQAGAGTSTLNGGYEDIVTNLGQTHTYTWTRALPSIATGAIVRRVLDVQSGGSVASDDIAVRVRITDGTDTYEVTVRASTTALRMMDSIAGTQVGVDAAFAASSKVEIKIAIADSIATAWWRLWTWGSSAAWAELGSTVALTSGGAGASQVIITWGHLAASVANSRWYEASEVWDIYTGTQQAAGIGNPEDLHGRGYSSRGSAAGTDGVMLRSSGVAIRGDQHTVYPDSTYTIGRLRTGSPRHPWRAAGATQTTLIYDLGAGADSPMGSDILALMAKGANVSAVKVYGMPNGGADVLLADVDLCEGMTGLKWTRSGDAIRVQTSSASTNTPFFTHGSLAGCQIALDRASTWDTRVIRRNRGGRWKHDAGRREVVFVEGIDGTEATSGTDARIIPSQWAVLIDMHGREYEKIKLVFQTPSATVPGPAETYHQIGRLVVGYALAPHYQPSWGTRITHEPNIERLEARDGTRTTTVLGPMIRRARIAWVDGIYTYNIDEGWHQVSDHASAEAMGTPGYELEAWVGIVQAMDDGAGVIGYLTEVDRFDGVTDHQVFNRRDDVLLADLEPDGVALDEIVTEHKRGDVLRLVELG